MCAALFPQLASWSCHYCCQWRYRGIASAEVRGKRWIFGSAKAVPCNQCSLGSPEVYSCVSLMSLFSQHLPNLYAPSVPHIPPLKDQTYFYMFCCLPTSNKLWLFAFLLQAYWWAGELSKHAEFIVLGQQQSEELTDWLANQWMLLKNIFNVMKHRDLDSKWNFRFQME